MYIIKRNVWLLYAIALLQGMVFYGPIATLYRQAVGVSVFQITLIESISLFLCIVLEVPWGILADKIGYRRTMIICCVLYFISKIVFWRADGFGGFLLERVMLSVIMAGLSGCDVSLLYLSCHKGESHRAFTIYSNLTTMGLLLSSLVYSVFIKEDYRLAGFLTIISYGAAMMLSLGLKEVRQREKFPGKNLGAFKLVFTETIRDKRFLLLLIGMALLAETRQTVTVFLSQLQYVKSSILPASMGYIYILVTVISMGGFWSEKLTAKWGKKAFALVMFGAAAASCAIMAVTSNPVLSVACIGLLDLSGSLFLPLQSELQSRHVTVADRATALSIYAVILEGTGVVTNLLFGRAAQYSLPLAMMCGAVLCVVGGLLFFVKQQQKPGIADAEESDMDAGF